MKDPNEAEIKKAIKDANLPQFPDFTQVNQTLNAQAQSNIHHTWRQRGPYLICTSCPHEHAQWIGTDKHLTGFGEGGKPILN